MVTRMTVFAAAEEILYIHYWCFSNRVSKPCPDIVNPKTHLIQYPFYIAFDPAATATG